MKQTNICSSNGSVQASYRCPSSCAFNTSLMLSEDVIRVTSAFDVLITVLSEIIIRILYKSTGYAHASS